MSPVHMSDHRISTALGMVNIALGVSVVEGGKARFPPPTYEPLFHLSSGQVWIYGLMFMVSGLFLLSRNMCLVVIGSVLGIFEHWIFSAMFMVAVVKSPDAGGTIWIAHAGYALLLTSFLAVAMVHWRQKARAIKE